jgi:hypothetical protein
MRRWWVGLCIDGNGQKGCLSSKSSDSWSKARHTNEELTHEPLSVLSSGEGWKRGHEEVFCMVNFRLDRAGGPSYRLYSPVL